MTKAQELDRPRSLGEVFDGLRPGAPCPWCGEGLQSRVPSSLVAAVGHDHGNLECEDETVLRCPECGAEVYGYPCGTGARGSRTLGAAA